MTEKLLTGVLSLNTKNNADFLNINITDRDSREPIYPVVLCPVSLPQVPDSVTVEDQVEDFKSFV